MGVSSNKIITALRDRRQIELDMARLLQSHSEQEFNEQAQQIAASGNQVVPAILDNLGRSTPQMLSVMGVVSSFYPDRAEITDRLYDIAADENRPDRQRIAALTILERFLGVEPDIDLINTLNDPQAMIAESIEEMLRQGEKEPLLLVEYVHGLLEQPEDTLEDVVEAILRIGWERAVPVLCLMAQDGSETLATAALHALGRLNHAAAVAGLQALLVMLPPVRHGLAERSLRKLQFKGLDVALQPVPADTWRALVSAPGGKGDQIIWFIRQADEAGLGTFIGIAISEEQGVIRAYGNHQTPAMFLPMRQPQGYIHSVSWQDDVIIYMLEADFDYGRRLVKDAQDASTAYNRSLPIEYRALGITIWSCDTRGITVACPEVRRPADALALLAETADLLAHPVFQNWAVYGDSVVQHALNAMTRSSLAGPHSAGPRSAEPRSAEPRSAWPHLKTWVVKLAKAYFDAGARRRLQVRLEAMAEWLWQARQTHLAQVALAAAETVIATDPGQHPFTLRMAERGLELVIHQLRNRWSSQDQLGSDSGAA